MLLLLFGDMNDLRRTSVKTVNILCTSVLIFMAYEHWCVHAAYKPKLPESIIFSGIHTKFEWSQPVQSR